MDREKELEELVRSFVLDTIDYATKNNLGDPEKQHNVKWARKLGIADGLQKEVPVAIQRIIEEVTVEKDRPFGGYNRTYHRHNR